MQFLLPETGRPSFRIPARLGIAVFLGFGVWLGACNGTAHPPVTSAGTTAAAQPTTPVIKVVPQESWRDAILYFVVVDRFADGDSGNNRGVDRHAKGTFHGGDLAGLRQQLDELADLGVTALWITPVVKNIDGFVTGAGFPDWGYHGYWADDFYALDPRFGSEAELKALVDDAHARGMKVLLDVVYNHAGYDSNYLKDPKTRGWLRNEALGTCGQDDLTSCVSGLPDFRTELPEVADYLLTAQLGLAKRVGVDGFRLDTVKHVDHPFWQEHRKRIREQIGPDFFLIGEVWGGDAQSLDPWFAGDEMDAGFDFSFQGNALAWVQGRGRTVAFDRYLKSREKVRAGHLLSPYLSSHDVPGALFQLNGDKELFRLAALLELTAGGLPAIYYGEEVGRPGGDWPDNRSDMPWGARKVQPGAGKARDEALRADYKKMIAIRRAHPAFARGVHMGLSTDGDLLVFLQKDEASGDAVVVAVNRGGSPATAAFDAPAEWRDAPVRDVWNGEDVARAGARIESAVAPRSVRIFTARR
ncbi:MAG TPA: alpha-amylase family glycosyl hydrolase [Thermoanaerobaculia bacterium]|nr:alpha-amylase family glycosyl hydrolase [Thermoanaerobaculia bacterium]